MRERAAAADRRGAAARLPRLRAGLGGEHGRLQRRVRPDPGPGAVRRLPVCADTVLYGIHDGGIPGTGSPTNRGLDPYVATRGGNGWSTEYVGIPADSTPSAEPFASPLGDRRRASGPSPSAAKTSAIRASPTAPPGCRCGCRRRTGAGHEGLARPRPAPNRRPRGQAALGRRQPPDLRLHAKFEPAGNRRQPTIYDRDLEHRDHPGRLDHARTAPR